MTVIAYRAGIMAGDSCWANSSTGTIDNLQNKMQRLKSGLLYGGAGDCDDRKLLTMLHRVKTPAQLPTAEKLKEIADSINALLVFPSGDVFYLDTGAEDGAVCPVQTLFAAVGSGRQIAIGAMAAGATAYSAVQITCQHNVYCRPPIHQLRLRL